MPVLPQASSLVLRLGRFGSLGTAAASAAAIREAKEKAEQLRGNTHAESEQIGGVYVTAGTEIDWPVTLQARLKLQQTFNRAQEVRRFIR